LKNVRIKILRRYPRARCPLAEKLGAYAIGLNFLRKISARRRSRRRLENSQHLAPTTEAVGVFVNWKPEVIMYLVTRSS